MESEFFNAMRDRENVTTHSGCSIIESEIGFLVDGIGVFNSEEEAMEAIDALKGI